MAGGGKMRFWQIGVVVLAVTVAAMMGLAALQEARTASLEEHCRGNLRQLTYAALAYGGDWKERLPTRISREGGVLNGVCRLPITGFDTATLAGGYPHVPGIPGYPVGGWGFLMRDFLKNDFDVSACPDGWYAAKDFMHRWDAKDPAGLYSEKMGYLWLPYRTRTTAAANGRRSVDSGKDIVRTCSDRPDLIVVADYVLWMGQGNTFRIAGNHTVNRASSKPCSQWPRFDPYAPSSGPPADRPACSNAAPLDARVKRRDFGKLPVYRYVVDYAPRVHIW